MSCHREYIWLHAYIYKNRFLQDRVKPIIEMSRLSFLLISVISCEWASIYVFASTVCNRTTWTIPFMSSVNAPLVEDLSHVNMVPHSLSQLNVAYKIGPNMSKCHVMLPGGAHTVESVIPTLAFPSTNTSFAEQHYPIIAVRLLRWPMMSSHRKHIWEHDMLSLVLPAACLSVRGGKC